MLPSTISTSVALGVEYGSAPSNLEERLRHVLSNRQGNPSTHHFQDKDGEGSKTKSWIRIHFNFDIIMLRTFLWFFLMKFIILKIWYGTYILHFTNRNTLQVFINICGWCRTCHCCFISRIVQKSTSPLRLRTAGWAATAATGKLLPLRY